MLDQQILESDAIAHFDDHEDSAYCIAVLERPEGPLFVSGDGRDKCYAWETVDNTATQSEEVKDGVDAPKVTTKRVYEMKGHTETVEYCKFDASGKWLVTGGMNNLLRVWDVANGFALKQTLDSVPNEDLNFVEWHQAAPLLLTGGKDFCVWMVNAVQNKIMANFIGHEEEVIKAQFTKHDGGK